MNEQDIINAVYFLVEVDSDPWQTTDDEYITARGLANIAINRWEKYENTTWNELITKLSDAVDGDKTTTDGVFTYACPNNFVRPVSFVRIGDQLFDVIPAEKIAEMKESGNSWVYFTGNPKDGYKLNINPNLIVKTASIEYEYYRKASLLEDPDDKTEMSDPYFIVYFVAAHMGDEGLNGDFYQMSEARLEQMRSVNMSTPYGVSNDIITTLDSNNGFGV